MERRDFLKAAGIAGVTGLAGCTGGPQDTGGDTTTQSTTTSGDGGDTTTSGETTTTSDGGDGGSADVTYVGMVYATGGLGDGSFNDQAQQGALRAKQEFNVELGSTQPGQVSEFATAQRQFAQSEDPDYDLVSCIGFLQTDALTQNSQDYPDQDFMLVDSVVDQPNVASYTFKEHQGSFLVGQMAGLLTTEDFSAGAGETNPDNATLGFVGGVEGDLIKKFEAGFRAGVKAANSSANVLANYTGSFNDPSAGKTAALQMYDSGADIIYHASGNTGTGVFQAAQEQGRFAIGVDRDQSVTKEGFADVILASMVKRVDTAVYNAIEAKVNGEFQGGSVVSLGLAEEGVGIVYGQELGAEISSSVKSEVEASMQAIIDGGISVPTDPTNV